MNRRTFYKYLREAKDFFDWSFDHGAIVGKLKPKYAKQRKYKTLFDQGIRNGYIHHQSISDCLFCPLTAIGLNHLNKIVSLSNYSYIEESLNRGCDSKLITCAADNLLEQCQSIWEHDEEYLKSLFSLRRNMIKILSLPKDNSLHTKI